MASISTKGTINATAAARLHFQCFQITRIARIRTTIGLSTTGQTASIDGAGLEYPGKAVFNGVLRVRPVQNLELGLQVYNLFDTFDFRGNGGIFDSSGALAQYSGTVLYAAMIYAGILVLALPGAALAAVLAVGAAFLIAVGLLLVLVGVLAGRRRD